jgi:hypothetical protein
LLHTFRGNGTRIRQGLAYTVGYVRNVGARGSNPLTSTGDVPYAPSVTAEALPSSGGLLRDRHGKAALGPDRRPEIRDRISRAGVVRVHEMCIRGERDVRDRMAKTCRDLPERTASVDQDGGMEMP